MLPAREREQREQRERGETAGGSEREDGRGEQTITVSSEDLEGEACSYHPFGEFPPLPCPSDDR